VGHDGPRCKRALPRFDDTLTIGRRHQGYVLRAPCERWIVWPAAGGDGRDPQENALADLGIRVVGYEETDQGFAFRVGRDVAATGPG